MTVSNDFCCLSGKPSLLTSNIPTPWKSSRCYCKILKNSKHCTVFGHMFAPRHKYLQNIISMKIWRHILIVESNRPVGLLNWKIEWTSIILPIFINMTSKYYYLNISKTSLRVIDSGVVGADLYEDFWRQPWVLQSSCPVALITWKTASELQLPLIIMSILKAFGSILFSSTLSPVGKYIR